MDQLNPQQQRKGLIYSILHDRKYTALAFLLLLASIAPYLEYQIIELINTSNQTQSSIVRQVSSIQNQSKTYVLNDKNCSIASRKAISFKKVLSNNASSFLDYRSWSHFLHYSIYKRGVPVEATAINYCENQTSYTYQGFLYSPPNYSLSRSQRFPSVQERIEYYMGDYYNMSPEEVFLINSSDIRSVPCRNITNKNDTHVSSIFCLTPEIAPEFLYNFISGSVVNTSELVGNVIPYTRDVIDLAILSKEKQKSPLLIHFGDGVSHTTDNLPYNTPIFGKVRDILASNHVNHSRYGFEDCKRCIEVHSHIIWPLNRARHFKLAADVPRYDQDFDQKINQLVWRGRIEREIRSLDGLPFDRNSWKQRMYLVMNHTNSSYINAKFTGKKLRDCVAEEYMDKKRDLSFMLQYKYQLGIEGNDVSSGLKWMLFSNSLVFIPPIRTISWAMESLLEPFVHFVPIKGDMSDLEQMIIWAEEHPIEVKEIIRRSTLFIYDLLFHPDAYYDEELVLKGILQRYQENFGY